MVVSKQERVVTNQQGWGLINATCEILLTENAGQMTQNDAKYDRRTIGRHPDDFHAHFTR